MERVTESENKTTPLKEGATPPPPLSENKQIRIKFENPGLSITSLEKQREDMRGWLAKWLVIALLAVLILEAVLPYVALWKHWATTENLHLLTIHAESPLFGLVGAAIGFYFGESPKNN